MEEQFPHPPPIEWYETFPLPKGWELIKGKLSNKDVLEIGCASGWISFHAMREMARCIATDIFSTHVLPSIKFCLADKESLPFEDNTYDYVLTSNVLHHGDLEVTTNEIIRVLKPGGIFISFIEPCIPNDYDEAKYLKEYLHGELDAGIDEHRPNLIQWNNALSKFSSYEIYDSNTLVPIAVESCHQGICIKAIK